jgi:Tol biopolymer transport system component
MPHAPGQSLLHYRLVDKIGEGGMGVVWRAVDTTLDREVAIKILPNEFAAEADRLARFEREAKLLASLNHPNIATVHGLHEAPAAESGQPIRFLAMELAEGEDLARRVARGPLALDDALAVARQIASALESAHESGVVHRDLKPANVVLAPDGSVKVLDFGLAKALAGDPEGNETDPSLSPTMTSAGTMAGVILGTAAYMSPEQARGKPVDRRVDIWAFGCVLYELLTGRAVHRGDTVSDTLAAVILREPDWDVLPASTPRSVRRVLERCLRKDPRSRLRDAGDARMLLEEVVAGEAEAAPVAPGAARPTGRSWIWPVAAVALVAGIGLGWVLRRPPAQAPVQRMHFRIAEPEGITAGPLALSPDGSYIVFSVVDDDGASYLWIRPLGSTQSRRLTDMSAATRPFWSADSSQIGFYSQGKLWRIGLEGGSPQPIGSVNEFYGATWNANGVILAGQAGPLLRFDTHGVGDAVPVTEKAEYESGHMWPDFLPDGEHFVYLADSNALDKHRIVLGSLDGAVAVTLASGSIARSELQVDPEGWLLWVRGQQLIAQRLDLDARALSGTPQLIADRVVPVGGHHAMAFTAADVPLVAYQQGSGYSELAWYDRNGVRQQTIGDRDDYANPTLSPDGRLLAVETQSQEKADERPIWIYDLERGTRTLLTERDTKNDSVAWAPDGRSVLFNSPRGEDQQWRIYRKPASGAGEAQELIPGWSANDLIVQELSGDGRWLLVSEEPEQGTRGWDLRIVDLAASDPQPVEWLGSAGEDDYARFSPDGDWVAYDNSESGQSEVYLRPREQARATERYQISVQGGHEPKWRRDGRELFYRDERGKLFVVAIDLDAEPVEIGIPQELFQIRTPVVQFERDTYDVTADGLRFVVNVTSGGDDGVVQVLSGWRP